MIKTPPYTLKANANHRKKLVTKTVAINKEQDADLLNAIDRDNMPFATRVKQLLKEYYFYDVLSDDYDDSFDFNDKIDITPTYFYDVGWEHGWVFGKYTKRVTIDDNLLRLLDNATELIKQYHDGYCEGFRDGLAERHGQMPTLIF